MESKNQTESLKFRKEDGEPSNPDNNVLNSEQHRIWKHHGKVKIALIAGAGVVGVGGGIGIGYAIPHTGPQIPKSLHITGVPPNPIEGAPNFAITPITLACETDTKVTIADAQYSASNLPAGLRIDSSNGQCTISGTPTAQTTDPCTIYTTSAATGLFSTATINFNIALNTLVISPTTLASDTALAKACNLKIEDGVLSRFNDWTTTGVNTKFNNYLADLGDFKTTAIQFEGVGSISERAFEGCGALGNGGGIEKIRIVDSPSGLGSSFIGGSAFKGCAGLTSVDLSGLVNLKVIDNGAFLNCASLTAINFPSSLEVIGNGAFSGCTALSSIALPESLKSIDNVAFAECEALTTIDLSKTAVTAIGSYTFQSCSALSSIVLPNSLESIGKYAFFGCRTLTTVDLSKTKVSSIGDNTFAGCTALSSIVLPKSLESIGQYTFQNCTALTIVDLSKTKVSSIGYYAFVGCEALKAITFTESLKVINSYAFDGCGALTAVDFSKTAVASINVYTFRNCRTLTTIDLSNTAVVSVKEYVFAGCTGLTTLKLSKAMFDEGNSAVIGESAFKGCTSLNAIYIPEGDASAVGGACNENAFEGCAGSGTIYYSGSSPNLANAFKAKFAGLSEWTILPNQ